MKQTVLRKVKRGGGFGRWPAYEIASDKHGRWLYSPKGTVYLGHPATGEVIEWEVGRAPADSEGTAEMHLVPPTGWWVAKWCVSQGVRRIAVDVCVPAVLEVDEWSFVDLELDPFWGEDGSMGVHDEDEFAAAIDSGLISSREASSARSATAEIVAWLRDGIEPFGATGWRRFDGALACELPPILVLSSVRTA